MGRTHRVYQLLFVIANIFLTVICSDDMCDCSCEYREKIDDSAQEMEQWRRKPKGEQIKFLNAEIQKVKKKLQINKTDIAAVKMTKISAPDNRTSAKHLGYIGISVLVVVFGTLILVDLFSLHQHIYNLRTNL